MMLEERCHNYKKAEELEEVGVDSSILAPYLVSQGFSKVSRVNTGG